MCVNEFYFCICFVKVNFQILEKFWKSEFPNIRKRVKISIYRHRLHRCKRKYQTILLSPVYKKCTSPKLATVSTIFTHLLIFYICFSLPQIIIKIIFFSISESFVSVKRVHSFDLLFIIIFVSKQSLDSPTLMTLILPTGRVF